MPPERDRSEPAFDATAAPVEAALDATAPPPGAALDATAASLPISPATTARAVSRAADLPTVSAGNYEMLGEYARGGLGRIVRARDRRTGRVVAIKEMLRGADDASARRFAREALVTANLQHPAIVPVYELGRWVSGEPFYAMKLVAGRSLHDVIADTASSQARLALVPTVVAVADALAYAHGQRTIHRDLKPANVLVGEFGETVVIDWGLAKVLTDDDDDDDQRADHEDAPPLERYTAEQTVAGAVMGTPLYMPPEQGIGGGDVDERADVYALGAILYHVITGGPPFADRKPKDLGELLAMVERGDVTPVEQLAPGTPRDLCALVGKAMSPDPARRYPSARELADDLRRFTNGQLVAAHHYNRRTLLARWVRRHRAEVTIAAILVGILTLVSVLSVQRILRKNAELADSAAAEKAAREKSVDEAHKARVNLATALVQKGAAAERAEHWADAAAYYAAARNEDDDRADARWRAGLAEARAIVPVARHDGHGIAAVSLVAIAPDGQRVASVDGAGGVRVWSIADGKTIAARTFAGEPLGSIAFAHDGRELAVGSDRGTIYRLSSSTLASVAPELRGHDKRVWSLAYAPDDRELASGGEDATIRVWTLAGGASRVLGRHDVRVYGVAFSPVDRNVLVSASDDRSVRAWSLHDGTSRVIGVHQLGGVRSVAFVDRGHVITTSWDRHASVWSLDAPAPTPPEPPHEIARIADTHSLHTGISLLGGRVLVVAGDTGEVRFFEGSTKQVIAALATPGRITALAATADEQYLVTAGPGNPPIVWSLHALRRLVDADGHRNGVHGIAFAHDGARLVTGSDDGTIRVWNTATGSPVANLAVPDCGESVQLRGSDEVVYACPDQKVYRHHLADDARTAIEAGAFLRFGSLSPDERVFAGGHMKGNVTTIDLEAGKVIHRATVHTHQVYGVTFDGPDRIVSTGLDGIVRVSRADLGPVAAFTLSSSDGSMTADASRDGTLVVGASEDGTFDVWRLATGERVAHVLAHQGIVWRVAFAPDGHTLATAGEDGLVKLWDTTTWRAIATLDAQEGFPMVVAVSPDNTTIAAGYRSGAIVLWDAASHTPRLRIGGGARDKGSCEARSLATQVFVDAEHRSIVERACAADAAAYQDRWAATSKRRVRGVDVVDAW